MEAKTLQRFVAFESFYVDGSSSVLITNRPVIYQKTEGIIIENETKNIGNHERVSSGIKFLRIYSLQYKKEF